MYGDLVCMIRGRNPFNGVAMIIVSGIQIEPNRSFLGGVSLNPYRVADLSQLLHNVRNVHALVPVCEHDGAKQGAIPLQHGGMRRIGHCKPVARHHEHAVEHGHQPPHVCIVAIHFAKILIQPKLPLDKVREMVQYLGIVSSNRIYEHFVIRPKHGFGNVLKVFVSAAIVHVNVFLVNRPRKVFQLFHRWAGRGFQNNGSIQFACFWRNNHG